MRSVKPEFIVGAHVGSTALLILNWALGMPFDGWLAALAGLAAIANFLLWPNWTKSAVTPTTSETGKA